MGEQRVSRSYNLDNQNFVVLLNFIKTIYRIKQKCFYNLPHTIRIFEAIKFDQHKGRHILLTPERGVANENYVGNQHILHIVLYNQICLRFGRGSRSKKFEHLRRNSGSCYRTMVYIPNASTVIIVMTPALLEHPATSSMI